MTEDQMTFDILSIRLESWGIRSFECNDPDSGINFLEKAVKLDDPFSIMIVDSEISDMKCENLAQRIKDDQRFDSIKVIQLKPMNPAKL
ncbi:hypothetical protein V6O07_10070, partial [Arthrospira platensis SPKY2]